MSVIVKEMQMPKSCMECPMFSGAGCKATKIPFNILTNVAVRVKGCPLVELPEKHGRLIDADLMINFVKEVMAKFASESNLKELAYPIEKIFVQCINEQLTVIKRETGKEKEHTKAHWIKENTRPKSTMYICSECGEIAYSVSQCRGRGIAGCIYRYCPNCGVKMGGVESEV